MATFLDVTGLQYFSSIFVFLFVWIIMYAMFEYTKVLGKNRLISALIGLLLGIFASVSQLTTDIVSTLAPFIAVIFVLLILMNTAIKMLNPGAAQNELAGPLGPTFLVIMIIVIIAIAALKIRDSALANLPAGAENDLSTTSGILFNPKFMGTVLVLGVAIFTIALLSASPK